ncbi:MAG: hypothetical protein ACTS73_07085 [Arsenophonus sp. NEOnobi-MAG3]
MPVVSNGYFPEQTYVDIEDVEIKVPKAMDHSSNGICCTELIAIALSKACKTR